MTDDVLAKLDRYLNNDKMMGDMIVGSGLGPALATEIRRQAEMVQRARDEIVALRAQLEAVKGIAGNERKLSEAIIQQARDEALEEAVQACTDQTSDDPPPGTYNDACEDCAAAIRALKEKR